MANFLSGLVSEAGGSLVDAVGSALDKLFTSDEERKSLDNELSKASMQYDIEIKKLGVQEATAYLADVGSARDNQSRVQESEHASWLSKNVQPMLAVGILGLTFFMYWFIVFSPQSKEMMNTPMKDIVIYILGALTTVATQVVSYFFGSSQGSAEKGKQLGKELAKKD